MAKTDKVSAPSRPTIILPPRTSFDSIFAGLSPGPMTLVSSFFSDSYSDSDCPSFSQLLAGAMASPVAADGGIPTLPSFLASSLSNEVDSEDACEQKLGFKQNRPVNLVVAHSPLFMVPPGLSPSGLLNSPGFFSPLQMKYIAGTFAEKHLQWAIGLALVERVGWNLRKMWKLVMFRKILKIPMIYHVAVVGV